MADKAGLSVDSVRRLECGRGTLKSFFKLLHALGLDLRKHGSRTRTPLLTLAGTRQMRDYSVRALAERLAVSRNTLDKLERGSVSGRLETLEAVNSAIDGGLYVAFVRPPLAQLSLATTECIHTKASMSAKARSKPMRNSEPKSNSTGGIKSTRR